ncbi:MAG: hypothetical protein A2511_08725 [Deltaproteobacteria bacterium RIFOXYD12_FULL_50_9]|nr:MAG: hypothetical protein A2511_08725 [Deltaproteobacteria bacterium RIFOXYD12_FULL_50_9]
MKIVVIGPGALGCFLAASLADQGAAEIQLLDHDSQRAARVAAQGILLERNGEERRIKVPATADPERLGRVDAILLCVKSHQIAAALPRIRRLASPDNLVIALQNGIAHLAFLAARDSALPWAAGVTSVGVTLLGQGHIRFGGQGQTKVGFLEKKSGDDRETRLTELAGLFAKSGLETAVVDNIIDHIWAKFFINIGINALTAIHNCPNGELLMSASVREQMIAAVREAITVAQALGIPISGDPVAATLKVCQATAGNISSMLQDVRNHRQTEIDAINGVLLKEAARLGVAVPVNESLVSQIRKLEKYG